MKTFKYIVRVTPSNDFTHGQRVTFPCRVSFVEKLGYWIRLQRVPRSNVFKIVDIKETSMELKFLRKE